jgi:predicted dehydrogenase
MRRIAVGLIGTGKHGARYAKHVREDVPELVLTAVSRRDAAAGTAQATAWRCRFHADWRALVADPAVEAVLAVVPPSLHCEIAAAVAAAGKPLLIEKPLAPTGSAAREVVRVLRAAGVPVFMAHTLRWNSVVRTIRDQLGRTRRAPALWLSQRFEPSPRAWLDDPARAGGGDPPAHRVHSFDLVRLLTGREVTRVWCRAARRRHPAHRGQLRCEPRARRKPGPGRRERIAFDARSLGPHRRRRRGGQLVGDHASRLRLPDTRARHGRRLAVPDPVPTVREALRAFRPARPRREGPPVALEDGARGRAHRRCLPPRRGVRDTVPVEPLLDTPPRPE